MSGTTGGINALIPMQAGVGVTPVENPLVLQQQYAQAGNALLQMRQTANANKLWDAQAASGRAYQGAVGPNGFDPAKYQQLLAADPSAAPAAAAGIESSTTLAGQQQAQSQNSQKQLSAQVGGLLSLNNGQGPTYAQLTSAIQQGVSSGTIQPQNARAALIGMPIADDPRSMATRTHILQTIQQQLAPPQEQLGNAYGTPTTAQNGQQLIPGMSGGMLGGNRGAFTPSGQPIQLQTSPETNAGLVEITNSDGSKSYVPRGSLPGASGVAGGGQGGPPAPGSPDAVLGTGRPGAPGSGSTPAPAQPNMGAGLAPGQAEAAQATAQAGAAQGVALGQTADAVPQRKASLDNMLASLQNFTPGPGADFQKMLNSVVNRTPFGTINAQGVASQEEFSKIGKQIALQQAGALGGGTNEKLETTMGANPNVDLSKLGNQQIIGMLKGNEDAIAAKNQAWQQWTQNNGTGTYQKFSTQFNQGFDPRAFQSAYMSQSQRQALIAGLSPQEKPAFVNTLKMGIANGTIPNPLAPTAAPASGQ